MTPRKPPSRSKYRAKQSMPTGEKSPGKSPAAPSLQGVAAHPELRGRGPAPGAPNAGRPRKAVRRLFLDILMNEGIEAAREVLAGRPDAAGRYPTHEDRLAWFLELSSIGLNEKVKLARIEASAAGATLQNGMQIILQGGPPGNLQPE